MEEIGTAPGGIFQRWCPACGRMFSRSMNPSLPGEQWSEPDWVKKDFSVVQKLRARCARLEVELADWKDSALSAENPHPDEIHCTCVPLLRKTVKDLREETGRLREKELMLTPKEDPGDIGGTMNFKVEVKYITKEVEGDSFVGTATVEVEAKEKNEAARKAINILARRIVTWGEAVDVKVSGNEVLVAAKKILKWAPGFRKDIPLAYGGMYKSKEEEAEQRKGVEGCPFVSEAYLYELLGKDDARTFRGMLDHLLEACNIKMHEIEYGR